MVETERKKKELLACIDKLIYKYKNKLDIDHLEACPLCSTYSCGECINNVFGTGKRPCVQRTRDYNLNWTKVDDFKNLELFWSHVGAIIYSADAKCDPNEKDLQVAILQAAEVFRKDIGEEIVIKLVKHFKLKYDGR